jgi:predicted nucleic acid-binding protein
VLVALLANEPESEAVAQQFTLWAQAGAELHAPGLARYEVANALARKAAHGEIAHDDLATVWAELDTLGINYHQLTDGATAIAIALELERRSAFDAAYVALAARIGAELWTIDGPLARNAGGRGFSVRLIAQA